MSTLTKNRERRARRLAFTLGSATVIGLSMAAIGLRAQPDFLDLEGGRWSVVARVQTGHQRAGRLTFYDQGRRLAVTCPRYDRLVLYRVTDRCRLEMLADRKLAGKPVAVREVGSELLVLQRPSGDARHLVPGFLQRYDFGGNPLGAAFDVGYDPDDLVILERYAIALVLLSGNREGESNRPEPESVIIDVANLDKPSIVSRLVLDVGDDDPTRFCLSDLQSHAAVLTERGALLGIDVTSPRCPVVTGLSSIAGRARPWVSRSPDDRMLLPDHSKSDVVWVECAGVGVTESSMERAANSHDYLVWLDEDAGYLKFIAEPSRREVGSLTLHGPAHLGSVRATSLAYSPWRNLIAIADRSGGVHLAAFAPTPQPRRTSVE